MTHRVSTLLAMAVLASIWTVPATVLGQRPSGAVLLDLGVNAATERAGPVGGLGVYWENGGSWVAWGVVQELRFVRAREGGVATRFGAGLVGRLLPLALEVGPEFTVRASNRATFGVRGSLVIPTPWLWGRVGGGWSPSHGGNATIVLSLPVFFWERGVAVSGPSWGAASP